MNIKKIFFLTLKVKAHSFLFFYIFKTKANIELDLLTDS